MFKKATCSINSIYGDFNFHCYNFGDCENHNVLVMESMLKFTIPLIRIQSACFTSEIFRSKDCDCHEQLETSLRYISEQGGFLIYLLQDGRGAGIFQKVKGIHISQTEGKDTAEAYDALGLKRDPREYDLVVEVLKDLKVTELKLLTNNPRKVAGLTDHGFTVERLPLEIPPTPFSESYLRAKKNKLGHLFNTYI